MNVQELVYCTSEEIFADINAFLERLLLDTKIAIIFFQDRCSLNTLALFRHFRVVYNRILCGIRRRGFLHRLRPILENHQDSNGEIGVKNN